MVQLTVKHRQRPLLLWAVRLLHTVPAECQAGRSAPIFLPLQHLLVGRNHPSSCHVLRVLSPSTPRPTHCGWRRAQHLQQPFPGDAHVGRRLFPTTFSDPSTHVPKTRHSCPGGCTYLTVPASCRSLGCTELLTETPAREAAPAYRGEL